MTLKDLRENPFSVQIKMDGAIGDTYTIKTSCLDGAVDINSGGILTFNAGNWGTNQNMSVTGHSYGKHKMKSISTSPYYVDKAGKLKEKTTIFEVEIVQFIGWVVYNETYANATSVMGCAKLAIGSHSASGLGRTFSVGKTGGGNTTNGLHFALIRPDASVVALDTDIAGVQSFVANLTGVYYLYMSTRTGSGAGSGPNVQSVTLGQPSDLAAAVTIGPDFLYFTEPGAQAISGTAPTIIGSTTLWTAHHPNVIPEIPACSSSCWFSEGGSGGLTDFVWDSISPSTLVAHASGCTFPPSSGQGIHRNYGYYYVDPSGFPPYDGVNTAWHYQLDRRTGVVNL